MYRLSKDGVSKRALMHNSPTGKRMSDISANQLDLGSAWAGICRRRYGEHKSGHKALREHLRCGLRTVAGYFQGESTPHFKHVLRAMRDDEMLAEMLRLAGRDDIADIPGALAKIRAAQKALEGLG